MELKSIKNEEKFMNSIMFLTNAVVPIAAFAFVMLFINGNSKDCMVLIMILFAGLTKLFEKKLGKYIRNQKWINLRIFSIRMRINQLVILESFRDS